MKGKGRYLVTGPIWGYIGTIVLLVCCLYASPVDAALTPQSLSGTVEVLSAGEQTWKPLTAAITLKTGDQVRTGVDGLVDLFFEDGSVLNVAENTTLGITELEMSTAQKTRVGRFKLLTGAVTAKIAKLVYNKSVIEVETASVLAGVKFSAVKVEAENSNSKVFALQGTTFARKIGEGVVNIFAFVEDLADNPEGLTFPLDEVGTQVEITVLDILRKITVQSEFAIYGLRSMIGGQDNVVKVDNVHQQPLEVSYSSLVASLEQATAATLGIKPSDELTLGAQQMNASFAFKTRALPGCIGMYIFADKGPIFYGQTGQERQRLDTGKFTCAEIGTARTQSRGGIKPEEAVKGEEQRVEPSAPISETAGGADGSPGTTGTTTTTTSVTPGTTSTGSDTLTPPSEDADDDDDDDTDDDDDDDDDDCTDDCGVSTSQPSSSSASPSSP